MPSQTLYLISGKINAFLSQHTASKPFDEYFIPISSIHSHSTRLSILNNLF